MTNIPAPVTSLHDVLQAIEMSDLALAKKIKWACSIRIIAGLLPPQGLDLPARWMLLSPKVKNLHHEQVNMTKANLDNHKSSFKSALVYLSENGMIRARGTPLTPAWAAMWAVLRSETDRTRLSSLFHWASHFGMAPEQIDNLALDRFLAYRRDVLAQKVDDLFQRALVKAWNDYAGQHPVWPPQALVPAPLKQKTAVLWEAFPASLRQEIEDWLASLQKVRRVPGGPHRKAVKSNTIVTRRRELQAYARRAVEAGVPVAELTSLSVLLDPDLFERVIKIMGGDVNPSTSIIDLSSRLYAMARDTKVLDEAKLADLLEMRDCLQDERPPPMTEKNLILIRRVISPGGWNQMCRLPEQLMAKARKEKVHSPVRAALQAQAALAIAILLVAPVRVSNLASIRIGKHLIRPGGKGSDYMLVFKHTEVKNVVDLEFAIDSRMTEFIDAYIREFRPTLVKDPQSDHLFPGDSGARKAPGLSSVICRTVERELGFPITAHQFRHAAASIILANEPGNYELVRQILGHKSTVATRKFYIALDGIGATKAFAQMVRDVGAGSPAQSKEDR